MCINIIEKYRKFAIEYGNELIIPKDYCIEFIRDCEKYNVAILGFEGFKILPGNVIEPQVDEIADFSALSDLDWNSYLEKSIKLSIEIINKLINNGKSDGYCFETDLKKS